MVEDRNEIESDGELTRREMLKLGAGAAVTAALSGLDPVSAAAQSKSPLFFTRDEFAMVDQLTELIIPADDHSPGARAAQAANYIDFRLSESLEDSSKTLWRDGLKLIEQLSQEMHRKPFLKSSADEQVALLTRISKNEENPAKPEERFFKELKGRTANAYYTSKIGIHTEMEYKGNTSLKEFAGYDAT